MSYLGGPIDEARPSNHFLRRALFGQPGKYPQQSLGEGGLPKFLALQGDHQHSDRRLAALPPNERECQIRRYRTITRAMIESLRYTVFWQICFLEVLRYTVFWQKLFSGDIKVYRFRAKAVFWITARR